MTTLELVPFHGDAIAATRTPEGEVLVSIRRVCDSLGVAVQSQLAKLRRTPWASITMIVTDDDRGSTREQAMIGYKKLPMWLAGINPRKVATEAQPKLIAYQLEAADVLANHFLGKPAVASPNEEGRIFVSEAVQSREIFAECLKLAEMAGIEGQQAIRSAGRAFLKITGRDLLAMLGNRAIETDESVKPPFIRPAVMDAVRRLADDFLIEGEGLEEDVNELYSRYSGFEVRGRGDYEFSSSKRSIYEFEAAVLEYFPRARAITKQGQYGFVRVFVGIGRCPLKVKGQFEKDQQVRKAMYAREQAEKEQRSQVRSAAKEARQARQASPN